MLHVQPLAYTDLVKVSLITHGDCEHHDPACEWAPAYELSFVEGGAFAVRSRGGEKQVSPGSFFLTYPAMEYTATHSERVPRDVCLNIGFSSKAIEELQLQVDAFHRAVHPATYRNAFLARNLRSACAENDLAVDTAAAEMLAELVLPAPEAGRYDESLAKLYAEEISWAVERIRKHPEHSQSLSRLAKGVGLSPFHFVRVFKTVTRTTPHQMVMEARLALASKLLREGRSVTDACLDSGFNNLSHFTRLFKRRFGVNPSQVAGAVKRKS
jgi:AraC family transcriptional regulator